MNCLYATLKDFTLIIYIYFLTRKVLTQNKIKTLTKLSAGKISQVVNDLCKKGLIRNVDKGLYIKWMPKQIEQQNIYAMISIKKSFFHSGINSLKEMLKWEREFISIKKELKDLKSYNKIIRFIDKIIETMAVYKKAVGVFSKILC